MLLDAFQRPCTFVMVKAAAAETKKNTTHRFFYSRKALDFTGSFGRKGVCLNSPNKHALQFAFL